MHRLFVNFSFFERPRSWRRHRVTSVRTYYSPMIREIGIRLLLVAGLAMTVGCRAKQSGSLSQRVENSSGSSKASVNVRPLTDRNFERTSERLARGRYLVNGIG